MTEPTPRYRTLVEALAAAQGDFPAVVKDRKATVKSEKGAYSYTYANLADVLAAVRPVLSSHGIALIQHLAPHGAGLMLHTELRGYDEVLGSSMPITAGVSAPQALGSALTYYRRYALMALVGVAAEEDDDDGQHANGHPRQRPADQDGPAFEWAGRKVPADEWLAAMRSHGLELGQEERHAWWVSEEQKSARARWHRLLPGRREELEAIKREFAAKAGPEAMPTAGPDQPDEIAGQTPRPAASPDFWARASYHIPINGKGLGHFQGRMLKAIAAAPGQLQLIKLQQDCLAEIDQMQQEAPAGYRLLQEAISARMNELPDINEPPFG